MKAQSLTYTEWSSALHGRARGTRLPINATLEVTHRCPLACAHCYNNLPVGDAEARRRELSADELKRIIDELADAGGLWLLFTGGEIFARRDFLDIYRHAKTRGFLITLFTNGTQITEAIADTLAEWPPFSIEITLYGRTRETYERLTGVSGSFDKCMRGIRLLKERALPLSLKTVAVTINQHEIADMQRFAEDELGVPFKFDGMINARIDCSHSPLDVRLSPADMVRLDFENPVRRDAWAQLADAGAEAATRPRAQSATDNVYNCGGGVSAFAVSPEGKMSICVLSQQDTYDLRSGPLREGWDGFLKTVRARPARRQTKCRDCRIRELCSSCAATAELENGDAETPVDYFCEVAHLRALAVGRTPPAHGACAFCAGGEGHAGVQAALADIQRRAPPEATAARRPASLAVVNRGAAGASDGCGGGCQSCGGGPNDEL
ncbi:MAG TPA: radical SAM protein [Polyangia bacterium]|nr:radical SAM protein [Polyangia bacterium]